MRRVVVTGLGMVSPLGCGVDTTWQRILNGESGARQIDAFDVSDLTSRIACLIPRGDGSDGSFNPDQWMEPKDQRKVDDFIVYAMCAARQALDDADWHPATEEDRCATGVMIGSGIGGLSGIADGAVLLKERGPRRLSPFFIPGPADQSRLRLRLDRARAEGPESFGGDRLFDRRACDRRRQPADRARRRRRDGRRRHRSADQPAGDGRLLRDARAVHRFQRHAGEGVAALRPRSRRLRDGRGRRHRRARGIRTRQAARREDLRRSDRLRHVGRRLSHHRAVAGWRRRLSLHDARR